MNTALISGSLLLTVSLVSTAPSAHASRLPKTVLSRPLKIIKPPPPPAPNVSVISPRTGALVTGRHQVPLGVTSSPRLYGNDKMIFKRVPGHAPDIHPKVEQWRVAPSTHPSTRGTMQIRPERATGQPQSPRVDGGLAPLSRNHHERHIDVATAHQILPSTVARTRNLFNAFSDPQVVFVPHRK